MRVVGETDRRPYDEAALFFDEIHQIFIAIVGGCAKQVRIFFLGEGSIRISHDGREKRTSIDVDEDRLVVADEFGK